MAHFCETDLAFQVFKKTEPWMGKAKKALEKSWHIILDGIYTIHGNGFDLPIGTLGNNSMVDEAAWPLAKPTLTDFVK